MDAFKQIRLDPEKIKAIRHHLHQYPETGLEETRTSAYIADHLRALGYEVHQGLAKTGVVGTLRQGGSGRSLGIRAEMDGLPMDELTGLPWASRNPGRMHACGHDGHMAMLLGAAEAIAQRQRFDGTVHLIFQPAEENVGGAKLMVEDGLFDLFPCDAVFALHNMDLLPAGQIGVRHGPIMAAVDEAWIRVNGRGGHGATPEATADPIVAGAGIVMALQTIVSRNIRAFEPAVVTVGAFHGGTVSNIIPNQAELIVGVRSFDRTTRDFLQERITRIAQSQAESYGVTAAVDYRRSYDATVNHSAETEFVRSAAVEFLGGDKVVDLDAPVMGSEDFCYMLQACPGAIFFLGTASSPKACPLHHPGYDFNDEILTVGAGFWTFLAEAYLGAPL